MIYSKKIGCHLPVKIETKLHNIENFGKFTKYLVKDNKITVGHIDIKDLPNGIEVQYIENYHPNLYSGFGKVADQIEVEHCVKRGLDNFEIVSSGSLNSHALHYLRGKRFYSDDVNNKLAEIISKTPKGEKFDTKFLGSQKMYMPKKVIEKYLEKIKENPLLK